MIERTRKMAVDRFMGEQLRLAKLELCEIACEYWMNVSDFHEDWWPEMSTVDDGISFRFGSVYFNIYDMRIPYLLQVISSIDKHRYDEIRKEEHVINGGLLEECVQSETKNDESIPIILREFDYYSPHDDVPMNVEKQLICDIGKFVEMQRITFLVGGMICDENNGNECPIGMLCVDLREEIVNMF